MTFQYEEQVVQIPPWPSSPASQDAECSSILTTVIRNVCPAGTSVNKPEGGLSDSGKQTLLRILAKVKGLDPKAKQRIVNKSPWLERDSATQIKYLWYHVNKDTERRAAAAAAGSQLAANGNTAQHPMANGAAQQMQRGGSGSGALPGSRSSSQTMPSQTAGPAHASPSRDSRAMPPPPAPSTNVKKETSAPQASPGPMLPPVVGRCIGPGSMGKPGQRKKPPPRPPAQQPEPPAAPPAPPPPPKPKKPTHEDMDEGLEAYEASRAAGAWKPPAPPTARAPPPRALSLQRVGSAAGSAATTPSPTTPPGTIPKMGEYYEYYNTRVLVPAWPVGIFPGDAMIISKHLVRVICDVLTIEAPSGQLMPGIGSAGLRNAGKEILLRIKAKVQRLQITYPLKYAEIIRNSPWLNTDEWPGHLWNKVRTQHTKLKNKQALKDGRSRETSEAEDMSEGDNDEDDNMSEDEPEPAPKPSRTPTQAKAPAQAKPRKQTETPAPPAPAAAKPVPKPRTEQQPAVGAAAGSSLPQAAAGLAAAISGAIPGVRAGFFEHAGVRVPVPREWPQQATNTPVRTQSKVLMQLIDDATGPTGSVLREEGQTSGYLQERGVGLATEGKRILLTIKARVMGLKDKDKKAYDEVIKAAPWLVEGDEWVTFLWGRVRNRINNRKKEKSSNGASGGAATAKSPKRKPREDQIELPRRGEIFEYEGERIVTPKMWPTKREGSRKATHAYLVSIIDEVLGPDPQITHMPDMGPAQTRYLCTFGQKGLTRMGKRVMLEIMAKVEKLRVKAPERYKEILKHHEWLRLSEPSWVATLWARVHHRIKQLSEKDTTKPTPSKKTKSPRTKDKAAGPSRASAPAAIPATAADDSDYVSSDNSDNTDPDDSDYLGDDRSSGDESEVSEQSESENSESEPEWSDDEDGAKGGNKGSKLRRQGSAGVRTKRRKGGKKQRGGRRRRDAGAGASGDESDSASSLTPDDETDAFEDPLYDAIVSDMDVADNNLAPPAQPSQPAPPSQQAAAPTPPKVPAQPSSKAPAPPAAKPQGAAVALHYPPPAQPVPPCGGVYEFEGESVRVPLEWATQRYVGTETLSGELKAVILSVLHPHTQKSARSANKNPGAPDGPQLLAGKGLSDYGKELMLRVMARVQALRTADNKQYMAILNYHAWMTSEHPQWVPRLWAKVYNLLKTYKDLTVVPGIGQQLPALQGRVPQNARSGARASGAQPAAQVTDSKNSSVFQASNVNRDTAHMHARAHDSAGPAAAAKRPFPGPDTLHGADKRPRGPHPPLPPLQQPVQSPHADAHSMPQTPVFVQQQQAPLQPLQPLAPLQGMQSGSVGQSPFAGQGPGMGDAYDVQRQQSGYQGGHNHGYADPGHGMGDLPPLAPIDSAMQQPVTVKEEDDNYGMPGVVQEPVQQQAGAWQQPMEQLATLQQQQQQQQLLPQLAPLGQQQELAALAPLAPQQQAFPQALQPLPPLSALQDVHSVVPLPALPPLAPSQPTYKQYIVTVVEPAGGQQPQQPALPPLQLPYAPPAPEPEPQPHSWAPPPLALQPPPPQQQAAWGAPPPLPQQQLGWHAPLQPLKQEPGWGAPAQPAGWGAPSQPQQPGWGAPAQPQPHEQPPWGAPPQPQPQPREQPAWGAAAPGWGAPTQQPPARAPSPQPSQGSLSRALGGEKQPLHGLAARDGVRQIAAAVLQEAQAAAETLLLGGVAAARPQPQGATADATALAGALRGAPVPRMRKWLAQSLVSFLTQLHAHLTANNVSLADAQTANVVARMLERAHALQGALQGEGMDAMTGRKVDACVAMLVRSCGAASAAGGTAEGNADAAATLILIPHILDRPAQY